jgi:general secretion pathway protein A
MLELASRTRAMDQALAAIAAAIGPVLITGAPGSGKTWLCRRMAERCDRSWRWAHIDLTSATHPESLYRMIGHRLGLDPTELAADPRRSLAEGLLEQSADGWRYGLIVDEVHTACAGVADELRIMSNRLGSADSFGAILLAGQTGLQTRLASQPLSALGNRLAARIHLRPIDADEALSLVSAQWPGLAWSNDLVESLHRDSGGNPRTLLRLAFTAVPSVAKARVQTVAQSPIDAPIGDLSEALQEAFPLATASVPAEPLLGAAKPPIHEEEGLIEVGWEPTPLEMNVEPPEAGSANHGSERVPAGALEEMVDDHYAALQAWNEWAANQGRKPVVAGGTESVAEDEAKADGTLPSGGHTQVWAEGPERFGPYSQLFSRMRHSKGQD